LSGINLSYTTESESNLIHEDTVLAVIGFGNNCYIDNVPGYVHCGLPSLGTASIKEVWHSDLPIKKGKHGPLFWSETDDLLVAGISIDEEMFSNFREATTAAYQRLLRFTAKRKNAHIVRMWSYIADINCGEGESERYKQFCHGRYEALLSVGLDQEKFPSACALGHAGKGSVVYLLASSNAGVNFENPRQMSAFKYPREYGFRPPSFARATLAEWGDQRQLFLSGTASIVGHKSMYSDSFISQLDMTCQNIDFLLKHVAEELGERRAPELSILKVYLRDKKHLDAAMSHVYGHFGDTISAVFLQADICRKELLVEIDGSCVL